MNVEGRTAYASTCACGFTTKYTTAWRKHRATCTTAKRERWTAEDRKHVREGVPEDAGSGNQYHGQH